MDASQNDFFSDIVRGEISSILRSPLNYQSWLNKKSCIWASNPS
nr:hypothetical protein [Okeania sp. SIO2F4]